MTPLITGFPQERAKESKWKDKKKLWQKYGSSVCIHSTPQGQRDMALFPNTDKTCIIQNLLGI